MSKKKYQYPVGTKKDKPSFYQYVFDYYTDRTGRVQLSEAQEEYRLRLVSAHALILQKHSLRTAAKIQSKLFGITSRTAMLDIKDSIRLFGNVLQAEKNGMRHVYHEKAMQVFEMAMDEKDLPSMIQCLTLGMKILGLDRDDPMMPNFEKLEANIYQIVIPEAVKQAITQSIETSGGVLNLSENPNTFTEYQEVDATPKEKGWIR